jgi:hypothetical protein
MAFIVVEEVRFAMCVRFVAGVNRMLQRRVGPAGKPSGELYRMVEKLSM